MKKISIFVFFLFLAAFSLAFAQSGSSETLTIVTYYPSPYGSYNELSTYSNTNLAINSGNIGVGTTTPHLPAPNGQRGNIDANDIYLRSSGTWLSGASGSVASGNIAGLCYAFATTSSTDCFSLTQSFLVGTFPSFAGPFAAFSAIAPATVGSPCACQGTYTPRLIACAEGVSADQNRILTFTCTKD